MTTASSATTSSAERGSASATSASGPIPRATSSRARRLARELSSPYEREVPSKVSAVRSAWRAACCSKSSGSVAATGAGDSPGAAEEPGRLAATSSSWCSPGTRTSMSPRRASGSATISVRSRTSRSVRARTVPASNSSVLNSTARFSPAGSPWASRFSSKANTRSNLDRPVCTGMSVAQRPGSRSSSPRASCWVVSKVSATWNSGWWDVLRSGLSASTSRSKGTSWWA